MGIDAILGLRKSKKGGGRERTAKDRAKSARSAIVTPGMTPDDSPQLLFTRKKVRKKGGNDSTIQKQSFPSFIDPILPFYGRDASIDPRLLTVTIPIPDARSALYSLGAFLVRRK